MTIATNIAEYTDYNSTDVSNAVTAATRICAQFELSDDVSIELTAVRLLERQSLERKARTDAAITVPPFEDIIAFIESLIGEELDDDIIVSEHLSPSKQGKSKWYNT